MSSTSTLVPTSKPMTNFESVGEFNENFGHPKHSVLQEMILETNPKLVKFRLSLISEEISELETAVDENDITEVIDALADILYVAYGMGQVLGINLDSDFFEHYQHLIPTTIPYAQLTNFEIVKKIMSNIKPMENSINRQIFTENPDMVQDCLSVIKEEYQNLESASETDLIKVSQSLVNLIFGVYKMGYNLGIDLDKAFRIVHLSNMSKLCQNEKQAIETIEHYRTLENFKDIDVRYRLSTVNPDYYVIYNFDTGKILKSKYFTTPNFGSLFEFTTVRKPVIIDISLKSNDDRVNFYNI